MNTKTRERSEKGFGLVIVTQDMVPFVSTPMPQRGADPQMEFCCCSPRTAQMPPHMFKPTLCSHRSTAGLGYNTFAPFHAKGFVECIVSLAKQGPTHDRGRTKLLYY